tara:strand:+ start:136 stop:984 length:849 start_codon:yes stop_codon:yes gene_type:complete
MRSNDDEKLLKKTDFSAIKQFEDLIINVRKLKNKIYGCPWQKAQTHESLIPFIIEESYEFINSIKTRNVRNMQEELGDILLQIMLHSEISKENKKFELMNVIYSLNQKIKERHPYVFEQKASISKRKAMKIWNYNKNKSDQNSYKNKIDKFLSNKFSKLSPRLESEAMISEVSKIGFRWRNSDEIFRKLNEEILELKEAIRSKNIYEINEEFGDVFFTLISLSSFLKIDNQKALNTANKKFLMRIAIMEELTDGKINTLTKKDLKKYWDTAKIITKRKQKRL